MNLEGLTLKLVKDHLEQELLGGKIYRVFMPTPHSLLLMIKRERDTTALLAELNGGSPALYIPKQLPENPDIPPAFCMLLRKHLEESRITAIKQQDLDRIITLEIDMLGASSKIITKKLIFELTGKNSNIILEQDGNIIDSIKHIGASQSSYRLVLPGKEYVAPPIQNGLNPLTAKPMELVQLINKAPAANFLKAFIANTVGLGKYTAGELLAAADILPNQIKLEPAEEKALARIITNLQDKFSNVSKQTVYAIISRTNQVKTILVIPPRLLETGMTTREFPNINEAICFAMSLKPIQLPQHEQLQKLVSAETAKLEKKLLALKNDLNNAQDAEAQRMLADTIMANIYQIKKGQTSADLLNIYNGEPVTISLAPVLSPTENAQAYYKRYNKYKRAQVEVQLQIEAAQEMLQYLESLDSSLMTAVTKAEIEEIRQEMIFADLIKDAGKKKKVMAQKSLPLHIKLNDEADIYIGKNNKQNDYVTFTIGSPRDLWFHTKDIPGSHLILKTSLPEYRQEDIELAVQLAAYFSKARNGSNIPVDCVQRRYVKKPAGSKPGFVIFTNQKTYYTTPEQTALQKLLE